MKMNDTVTESEFLLHVQLFPPETHRQRAHGLDDVVASLLRHLPRRLVVEGQHLKKKK